MKSLTSIREDGSSLLLRSKAEASVALYGITSGGVYFG
jgi:hypothetical protein